MKIHKVFLILLLCMQTAVHALPLTIINNTKEIKTINIHLQSGTQKAFLEPGTKWTSPLNNNLFLSITWDSYNVNIQQEAPAIVNGGAFVIGADGRYMYDYKSGKVHFGQAQ